MSITEQMFCSKCGKVNFSKYDVQICECKEPDFSLQSHEEFLEQQKGKR